MFPHWLLNRSTSYLVETKHYGNDEVLEIDTAGFIQTRLDCLRYCQSGIKIFSANEMK